MLLTPPGISQISWQWPYFFLWGQNSVRWDGIMISSLASHYPSWSPTLSNKGWGQDLGSKIFNNVFHRPCARNPQARHYPIVQHYLLMIIFSKCSAVNVANSITVCTREIPHFCFFKQNRENPRALAFTC